MRRFHSAFQPSNETIDHGSLLTSLTVQGRQIPSSSTASALKPTVSGSTNACDFGQLCIQLVRSKQVCDQQSVVYCPSVIQVLIAHVSTKT